MTTTSRIYFTAWGSGLKNLALPAYAMADGYTPRSEIIAESIARKNSLRVAAGPRADGHRNGRTTYQLTLGCPCHGGGYTDLREIWICGRSVSDTHTTRQTRR
jgi:hypothetical protein